MVEEMCLQYERKQVRLEKTICYASEWLRLSCYHATPRRARVRFEAAVTPLSSSPHQPLTYIASCITNTTNHTSDPLTNPTYTTPRNTRKPPDS